MMTLVLDVILEKCCVRDTCVLKLQCFNCSAALESCLVLVSFKDFVVIFVVIIIIERRFRVSSFRHSDSDPHKSDADFCNLAHCFVNDV